MKINACIVIRVVVLAVACGIFVHSICFFIVVIKTCTERAGLRVENYTACTCFHYNYIQWGPHTCMG